MSIRKTLGGDRLGAGKKMTVDLHNYERSTHDLGYLWRNTMSAGTLVPFMVQYALPGDTFDIDINADAKTYPTVGPLFGSFKLQMDVFQCPIRLYQGSLHNNKLGIGMEMSKIKLPQLEFKVIADNKQINPEAWKDKLDGKHINESSIFPYLGIRGLGKTESNTSGINEVAIQYNAIPYLAYWDIYKNYYANKQEEIGMVIHEARPQWTRFVAMTIVAGVPTYREFNPPPQDEKTWTDFTMNEITIEGNKLSLNIISIKIADNWHKLNSTDVTSRWDLIEETPERIRMIAKSVARSVSGIRIQQAWNGFSEMGITKFPLSNLDDMREEILKRAGNAGSFIINRESLAPYGLPFERTTISDGDNWWEDLMTISAQYPQEGIALKTHQSDLFNNWLSTEWIDGANGISAVTAIDTSDGNFTLDTLNLSKKVYDMLNRIAVSGGSYDDWIEAVYAHQGYRRSESPIYHGGLSKEVVFQEVTSTAGTADALLGDLGGKGRLSDKHKGGKVTIKVDEPSVLIGIVSLTPRVDYSQGNDWHINLKTMDDFHKPALDQIGFQELITDQMAAWDKTTNELGVTKLKSAGKQPAWINYMTNHNRAYGNFADEKKEMYMTLNRRYEADKNGNIKDLTTYIDPSKYNYIFMDTELSAMNFWIQLGVDITARRKMSAKVMPNL